MEAIVPGWHFNSFQLHLNKMTQIKWKGLGKRGKEASNPHSLYYSKGFVLNAADAQKVPRGEALIPHWQRGLVPGVLCGTRTSLELFPWKLWLGNLEVNDLAGLPAEQRHTFVFAYRKILWFTLKWDWVSSWPLSEGSAAEICWLKTDLGQTGK